MKKPRAERLEDDAYMTPPGHALAICRWLDTVLPTPKRIIEPSAGGGAFVRAARTVWPSAYIVAVDVRAECEAACLAAGANEFHAMSWEDYSGYVGTRGADLVLGNPPYLYAEGHARDALSDLLEGAHLAFLLRSSFLSGQKRALRFWPKHPLLALAPVADRPSFTPDGQTDGAEYAVFLWQVGFLGAPRLGRHIWSEEALRRNQLRVVREPAFNDNEEENHRG